MAKPLKPEPKYFLSDDLIAKGRAYYEKKYFNHDKEYKAYGEKSTSYSEYPKVIENIKRFYPEAKFILILRNPVERAISNYFFSFENQIETRSLEEVFIKEIRRPDIKKSISVSPFDYKKRGIYADYVLSFIDNIDEKYLKIIILEELIDNINLIKELYRFVGVTEEKISENIQEKVNDIERSQNIPKDIYNKLHDYYQKPNEKLGRLLNKNLENIWK